MQRVNGKALKWAKKNAMGKMIERQESVRKCEDEKRDS